MKRILVLLLVIVFSLTFVYGVLAQNDSLQRHKPVVRCITDLGTIDLPAEHQAGIHACEMEDSFRLDLCVEESRMYDCFYRFKDGECYCYCKPCCLCI